MYKHNLKTTDGETFEWTNEQDKVLPCYFGFDSCMFFYYQVTDTIKERTVIFPASQVAYIITEKIGG